MLPSDSDVLWNTNYTNQNITSYEGFGQGLQILSTFTCELLMNEVEDSKIIDFIRLFQIK